MPIEVQAQTLPADVAGATAASRIGARERMFFTERIALLLDTGIPLHSSLDALERQAGGSAVGSVIRELRQDIGGGLSFAQALRRQPESFASTYVNLVDAGERGGFLPEVLEKLRAMDEKRQELNGALVAALSYPVFLLLFSLAVVLFVLISIFPKFAVLFEGIYDQLPITTRALMAVSDLFVVHWIPIVGALALVSVLVWQWSRRPDSAATIDRFLLGVPFLRSVIIELNLVQFLNMISLSLLHGVSLVDSLRACREIARSASFRAFIRSLEQRIEEGGRLASAFEESDIMPPLVRQMMATGEEASNLQGVAQRVAEFYEREWRRRLALFSKIIEPLMLLVMGAVVGVLVASLILPIFKLSGAVH